MIRVIRLKSTTGNDREYIISHSKSQPLKFWNLDILKRGKQEYQETGYRTIKEARKGIDKYQLSYGIYK